MDSYKSPDILSQQCVSAYLMRELATDSSFSQSLSKRRECLPRKAKITGSRKESALNFALNFGNAQMSKRRRKLASSKEEEDIDNQKHSRAMEVLYHLQQRQEQVSIIIGDSCNNNAQVEPVEAELIAIEEALSRLTRIFNLAKDELNNSQYFPCIDANSNKSIRRKQLQMNARLTKCTSLNKVQKALRDQFNDVKLQIITEPFPVSENTSVENSIDGSQASSSGYGEVQDSSISSIFSPASTQLDVKSVPFRQPYYSQTVEKMASIQKSQAQSLLDDIFGDENLHQNRVHRFDTSQKLIFETPPSQHSIITHCHGKMFVSPPRQLSSKQSISLFAMGQKSTKAHNDSNSMDSTKTDGNDMNGNNMDGTGIFEPSQREINWCTSHDLSISLFGDSPTNNKDLDTIIMQEGSAATSNSTHHHSNDSTETLNRFPLKFEMQADIRVAVVSNEQLTDCLDNLALDNLWSKPGYSHLKVTTKLTDMIDSWD